MPNFPDAPPDPSQLDKELDKTVLANVDERISLDQKSNTWVYDSGGVEYGYNYDQKQWIPITKKRSRDEDDVELEKEEEQNKQELKKLKKERLAKLKDEINRLKLERIQRQQDEQPSSAVFISGLPLDCIKDELVEVFSKFGVISEDFTSGEPRIKMYTLDSGEFKGEALLFYVSKDSVPLAIEMLDDTLLRTNRIKVEAAQFNGEKKSTTLTDEQKKLMKNKKDKLMEKLNNWDDDRDDAWKKQKFNETKRKIFDKIVVVEKMFRVEELKKDPVLELDLKEDITEECNKLGISNDITKISVHEETGQVTIKFTKPELSEKCIKSFNGRYFDGLKLNVHVYEENKISQDN